MRPDYQVIDQVPLAYRGLVTWVAGEHNSLRLTSKGTKHAVRLLATDPAEFHDVVDAARRAADPTRARHPAPGGQPRWVR